MANELKLSNPLVVGSFSSDPVTAFAGEIYFNTTSNVFRIYNGTSWSTVSNGSVSLTGQSLNNHNIIVGNGSNSSAAVDTNATGDILADSSTALTIKSNIITNSEINSAAAISVSKLVALTANRAVASDSSGFLTPSSTTDTELSFVHGVTSAIQTQLNSKLNLSGGTMSGNINMGSNNITNMADPVNPQDAATKNYTDNLAQSLTWKDTVRSATTGVLAAYTYSNGTSGVGATITATSNGALAAQDGVTLVVNDRLLVKNETSTNQPNNGIYTVTQVGDGSHPFILTRALDMDDASEFFGATVQVGPEASTQAGYGFRQNASGSIVVGTTNINFTNFVIGTSYTFNNGLALTGSTVNVVPGDNSLTATTGSLVVKEDAAGAISTGGSGIKVNTDGSTTQITSNNVAVKLDTGATTGNIISSGSGLKNQLESSNPTLQVTSSQLGVKLNGSGAIVSSSGGIEVQLESSNPTLQISTNQLGVKLDGARAITTGASGIGVNVDNSTIDINGSNQVEVKSGGISNTQVNASAAIALTKLAALNTNIVPVTDGSGFLTSTSSSDTPLVSNSLQRGKSAANVVKEEYIHSTTLTDNSSSQSVTALQFAHGTFSGEEITYVIETGAGTPDLRMGTLRVVSNGTTTSLTDTFTETADCGVSWAASISSSNTLVSYTTTNQGTNRTLRADRKVFLK